MAGRPSKYTPERAQRIVDVLKAGNTRRAACAFAGVTDETFANWQRRYLDFLEAVQKAEAEAEVRNVAIVQQAAKTKWQAAAWWLERRRSADYAQHIKEEKSGEVKVSVVYSDQGADVGASTSAHSTTDTDL